MNENEIMQGDEISLFDFWEKLRDGWRYVVGGTLLGFIGAGFAIMLLPSKYEAVAIVQVGQFVQIEQIGQTTSLPVEPPTQAIERMKTPAFQMAVAEKLGDKTWAEDLLHSSSATAKYLTLQLVKASVVPGASPLIEVKATSDSPVNAKKTVEFVVVELATRQAKIAKPMIDKMRLDLAITKEKLANAEKELEGLNKLVANAGVKDDRFTQLSLMTSLRVQKESEVFGHRQTILAYETALMPPATQPAKAIEAVFVVDNPVSPRKTLLLVLGLIGGLMVGVAAVFFVDAWRRAKREPVGH